MHIAFDTLDELNAFMEWAGYQKRAKYALQQLLAEPDYSEPLVGCGGEVAQQPDPQEQVEAAAIAPEGAKRKRRTKAEIEAEIEAEKTAAPPAEWPFTPPASFETAEPEVAPAAVVAETSVTPVETLTDDAAREWVAQLAAKLGAVDAAKHLDQCRAFIQAHGMTAYAAAGAFVELTASPVGFDDAQRALHSAALDYWATANAK
jgi:hypothetical protein